MAFLILLSMSSPPLSSSSTHCMIISKIFQLLNYGAKTLINLCAFYCCYCCSLLLLLHFVLPQFNFVEEGKKNLSTNERTKREIFYNHFIKCNFLYFRANTIRLIFSCDNHETVSIAANMSDWAQ